MSNIPIPPPPGAPGYQSVPTPTSQFHGVQYYVQLPGMHGQTFSFDLLSSMAVQRVLKPGSLVQVVGRRIVPLPWMAYRSNLCVNSV